MSVSLHRHLLDNPALQGVISVDDNQQARIIDQNAAMVILAQSDANSSEYRIIQGLFQMANFEQQNFLTAKITLGEKEITRLKTENEKLSDELTKIQIREDRKDLISKERHEGLRELPFLPLCLIPPVALGMLLGACPPPRIDKIFTSKSKEMSRREAKMENYKAAHPKASLTEMYKAACKNGPGPIKI